MKSKTQKLTQIPACTDGLRQWIPISFILLVAFVLYFYQLGTESLWNEELYSVHDAKDFSFTKAYIRPLYYIVLKIWMQFGTSEAWMRGLSVFFGLITIFLTYKLGCRVAGETIGLIAALLLTLSPLFINFAQMVRMYSLGTCLGVGGTLALVHALENPTASSMGWWASTRILMFLTTPLNMTLLLPDVLLFCLRFRTQRSVLLAFGKWLLLVIILCMPSLFTLISGTLPFLRGALDLSQKVAQSEGHSFSSFIEILRKLKNFTAFPFPSTSKVMSLFYQGYTLMLACLLSLALVKKHRSAKLLWIAAWTFLPSAMIFFVSQRLGIDRYLLFISPYILILLAAGFMRVWHLQKILAIIVAIVYLLAVSGGLVRYYTVQDRQDWRGLAQTIAINEKSGDSIILSVDASKMTKALAYYYPGSAPIVLNSKLCPSSEVKQPVVEEALDDLLPIQSRLWLVCGEGFDEKKFRTVFGKYFQLEKHAQFINYNFYRQNDFMHLFLVTPVSAKTQEE
ncbi:glycosyltransferase family 39 protein [Pleurocapsales cyanobacterium LEGE 06147]|nr:glycosyltransferase family 39 protein [Pleurocapsales cyanobacterium LEGE 06147]